VSRKVARYALLNQMPYGPVMDKSQDVRWPIDLAATKWFGLPPETLAVY
jgi:hypothetical protein